MARSAFQKRSLINFTAAALMLAFLWLTVGLPFALNHEGVRLSSPSGQKAEMPAPGDEPLPWNNMTEEKSAEAFSNLNEDYLHDAHVGAEHRLLAENAFRSDRGVGACPSFHGELLVPPPNAA